jgi:hypothetical protein
MRRSRDDGGKSAHLGSATSIHTDHMRVKKRTTSPAEHSRHEKLAEARKKSFFSDWLPSIE